MAPIYQQIPFSALRKYCCLLVFLLYYSMEAFAQPQPSVSKTELSGFGSQKLAIDHFAFPFKQSLTEARVDHLVLGGKARLTANKPSNVANDDAVYDNMGSGYLRLTEDKPNQIGYAYFDTKFPAHYGVDISFDYFIHLEDKKIDRDTSYVNGGDGFSVFLFDGNIAQSDFTIGADGAYLGYADDGSTGLNGAFLGIGFDAYGNFASTYHNLKGSLDIKSSKCAIKEKDKYGNVILIHEKPHWYFPNTISVRGPKQADPAYKFLFGNCLKNLNLPATAPQPQPNPNIAGLKRDAVDASHAAYRAARVIIAANRDDKEEITSYDIQVHIKQGKNSVKVIYEKLTLSQLGIQSNQIPRYLKIGFAAVTGAAHAVHEFRNLNLSVANKNKLKSPKATKDVTSTCKNVPKLIKVLSNDTTTDNRYLNVIDREPVKRKDKNGKEIIEYKTVYAEPNRKSLLLYSSGTPEEDTGTKQLSTEQGTFYVSDDFGVVQFAPKEGFVGKAIAYYTYKDDLGAESNAVPIEVTVENKESCIPKFDFAKEVYVCKEANLFQGEEGKLLLEFVKCPQGKNTGTCITNATEYNLEIYKSKEDAERMQHSLREELKQLQPGTYFLGILTKKDYYYTVAPFITVKKAVPADLKAIGTVQCAENKLTLEVLKVSGSGTDPLLQPRACTWYVEGQSESIGHGLKLSNVSYESGKQYYLKVCGKRVNVKIKEDVPADLKAIGTVQCAESKLTLEVLKVSGSGVDPLLQPSAYTWYVEGESRSIGTGHKLSNVPYQRGKEYYLNLKVCNERIPVEIGPCPYDLSIDANQDTVLEGKGVKFTITVNQPVNKSIEVPITISGTESNYRFKDKSLVRVGNTNQYTITITKGEEATFVLSFPSDLILEPTKTLTVALGETSSDGVKVIATPKEKTIKILDPNRELTITANPIIVTAGEKVQLKVSLPTTADGRQITAEDAIRVALTRDPKSTAEAGKDYSELGNLVIQKNGHEAKVTLKTTPRTGSYFRSRTLQLSGKIQNSPNEYNDYKVQNPVPITIKDPNPSAEALSLKIQAPGQVTAGEQIGVSVRLPDGISIGKPVRILLSVSSENTTAEEDKDYTAPSRWEVSINANEHESNKVFIPTHDRLRIGRVTTLHLTGKVIQISTEAKANDYTVKGAVVTIRTDDPSNSGKRSITGSLKITITAPTSVLGGQTVQLAVMLPKTGDGRQITTEHPITISLQGAPTSVIAESEPRLVEIPGRGGHVSEPLNLTTRNLGVVGGKTTLKVTGTVTAAEDGPESYSVVPADITIVDPTWTKPSDRQVTIKVPEQAPIGTPIAGQICLPKDIHTKVPITVQLNYQDESKGDQGNQTLTISPGTTCTDFSVTTTLPPEVIKDKQLTLTARVAKIGEDAAEAPATEAVVLMQAPAVLSIKHDTDLLTTCAPNTVDITDLALIDRDNSSDDLEHFKYYSDPSGEAQHALSEAQAKHISRSGIYYIKGIRQSTGQETPLLQPVSVIIHPAPMIKIKEQPLMICGDGTVNLYDAILNQDDRYTYEFTKRGSSLAITTTDHAATAAEAGIYEVAVTNNKLRRCTSATATIQVVQARLPHFQVQHPKPVPVPYGVDLTAAVIPYSKDPDLDLSYYESDQATSVADPYSVGAGRRAGTYTYYIRGQSTKTGCWSEFVPVKVQITPVPTINISSGVMNEGEEHTLTLSLSEDATLPEATAVNLSAVLEPVRWGTKLESHWYHYQVPQKVIVPKGANMTTFKVRSSVRNMLFKPDAKIHITGTHSNHYPVQPTSVLIKDVASTDPNNLTLEIKDGGIYENEHSTEVAVCLPEGVNTTRPITITVQADTKRSTLDPANYYPSEQTVNIPPNGRCGYMTLHAENPSNRDQRIILEGASDGFKVRKGTITLRKRKIFVHPVVSRDGNGINDFLYIENIQKYPNNTVWIIDRASNQVYEKKGYNNEDIRFDGLCSEKGVCHNQFKVGDGIYYYKVSITLPDGSIENYGPAPLDVKQ